MAVTYKLLAACRAPHSQRVLESFAEDPQWHFLILENPCLSDLQSWLQKMAFDCLLLSLQTGETDVPTLLSHLQEVPGFTSLPVVLMVSSSEQTEHGICAGNGIHDVLVLDENSPTQPRQIVAQAVRSKAGSH